VEWSADSVIVGLVNALADDFSMLGSKTAIVINAYKVGDGSKPGLAG
jgi:hypothetical protein